MTTQQQAIPKISSDKAKLFWPLLLFAFLLFDINSFAQTTLSKADSLLAAISNSTTAEAKVSLQLDLAEEYFEKNNAEARKVASKALRLAKSDKNELLQVRALFILGKIEHVFNSVDKSQSYFDTALLLSQKLNNRWYEAEVLLRIGINHHARSEHVPALEFFTQAIKAGRDGDNYRIVGASYSMMGTIFRVNGLYDRAIENIIKAKYNYKVAEFYEGEAWSAYLLGRIYRDVHLPDEALHNLNEALVIYEKMVAIDRNESGIAICKEQLGLLHLENGNLVEARKNIMSTLKSYNESQSHFGISNAYKNLGYIEYASGNYPLAYEYLSQSLKDKNKIGELLSLPGIYHHLGLCEIKMGDRTKGLATIEKGLEMAVKNNQKKIEVDIYQSLVEIHVKENELSKALFYQSKQITIQDTMLLGSASIKLEQLQGIYEVDEQNYQIDKLKERNLINDLRLQQHRTTRIYLAIGIAVALFIALSTFIFYHRIQQKNKLLAEANAAKDRFFAIIAHDLRGPCSTLTTFLGHVLEEFDDFDPEELKEMLRASHQSSEKVSTLLDTLLIWANSQRNKIDIKPEKLALSESLNQALESLKQTAEKKQINISSISSKDLFVKADANMLQTILRNLLSNAIKFTPRQGEIKLTAKAGSNNQVIIRISDTGVGIRQDHIQHLFKLSNKHHTRGTENESSSGLGLILVKEFVDKNHGTISINSKEGKGTIVSVQLPMA